MESLTSVDRIFIEQTLPGIQSTVEASNVDVKKLKDKLQSFKQTFYLLANQVRFLSCVTLREV